MKTTTHATCLYPCASCGQVHSICDHCERPHRESKRDRKLRESRDESTRLNDGLRQMEGDGR